ncbi:TonB-dependent receptor [Chryseosolibacter indicus]|uniref:TonB-dependent receptor n=1 Tax=Chryseosolibacter indicus TaxID=2782351 RepID=A0ABS5VX88_9BACT|nr:TonB-dependent receptor [Chryseosolibacter indicus]MBT1704611.1 TonB-dependent receptor [Chryseosolibacter indicus]
MNNLKQAKQKAIGFAGFAVLISVLQLSFLNPLLGATHSAKDIYAVEMHLKVSNAPLHEIFKSIEDRTEFRFTYSSKNINLARLVTIEKDYNTLGKLLDFLALEASLEFKQLNTNILVKSVVNSRRTAAQGTISGRVTDGHTKEVLPGATIYIAGTTIGTTSDVNGEYLLRASEGEYQVEVSYIGYKKFEGSALINSNQNSVLNISLISDATELKDVTITGMMQGQQRALNQQRSAENIKNVVSADQIGRFPDPNVAEALQRVPAVNIERDQGEGRYVLVRGLAPQFTNISINGEQIPSPEAGVRFVALDAIPADQLASIEVSKALTPDMDGDAIGGNVNLITRTAQSSSPSISASALAGYNQLVGRTNLQGSLEVSKRFFNDKLGIMLNSSYYETDRGSDNWERDDNDLELRDYDLVRTRLGLSGTIDYRFNGSNEVYFRTIYNKFTDHELRRRYIFVPNIDDSPFEENNIERFTKDRLEKQMVSSFNLGAKHNFPHFSLDYEAAYAEAIQDTPFDVEVGSVAEVDQLAIDFTSDKDFPQFSVDDLPHTSPSNVYLDNSIYKFDEFVMGRTYATDINKTAKINLMFPLKSGNASGSIKLGGKVRMKEKKYDVSENVFSWEGGNVSFPGFEEGNYTLEKFQGGTVDNNFLDNRYQLRANADPAKVIRHFNQNKNGYELDVESKLAAEAIEAYQASEDVYAGYLMSKWQISKLMILGGIRYEKTNVSYDSKEVIYDFQGNLEEIIPVSGSTNYYFVLPQLHLKYSLKENTNIRLAATRSYARPNFQDIIPSQEIELNSREGFVGNPALKPVEATNLDFMTEHYFGANGILSGGVFYKKLNNFIFNRRFQTSNYPGAQGVDLTLTQAQNGEDASLFGFEIAYQHNLTFLPGVLKDLSIYANYTFTYSNADIQSRNDLSKSESIRLPGQAKNIGNLSIAYDWKRLNIRISSNFNGSYLSEVGEDADDDLYVNDRMQLDATATFTITPKLRMFTEFLNITNQPFEVYQGSTDQFIQREFYSWWTRVGLKLDL